MTRWHTRRIFILFLAVIMLAIPIITPLLELSDSHNHTCSANRCLLCNVSGALNRIADLSAVLLFALLPLIILYTRAAARPARDHGGSESPIELKTKILS